MSVGQVFEGVFTSYVVSPQGQYIVNVEEVKVDQSVFDVVTRLASADQVGNDGETVPLHDGGGDADRPRTATYRVPFEQTVLLFDIFDIFTV